ncbi:hypothetical protein [Marinomonas shanghaiensis]|jgi:hypothetical protein|uniref:hypothetical protein n=1 Tax=Marinomonas shanghaiensis TaxID=2202418 RepID=UPI000DB907D1|nr:hypothetical protein [Marinomonas shanghaiensis]
MKRTKTAIYSFMLLTCAVHAAEDSAFDKAKGSAQSLWERTKTTTSEMADATAKKASEFGDKASEVGAKASKDAKETGVIVWDKMQEVGEATADSARKGASKIRSLVGQEDCKEGSIACESKE